MRHPSSLFTLRVLGHPGQSLFFWMGRIVDSYFGGRLSDKHERGIVAIGAMLGSTRGFIVIAVSNGIWQLVTGAIVTGLSIEATFPVGVALISDHISENTRGMAMGIFETGCGIGVMAGAAIGGVLADMYSPRSPYVMAALVNLACAVLFIVKQAPSLALRKTMHVNRIDFHEELCHHNVSVRSFQSASRGDLTVDSTLTKTCVDYDERVVAASSSLSLIANICLLSSTYSKTAHSTYSYKIFHLSSFLL